jgi:hypothetical protein
LHVMEQKQRPLPKRRLIIGGVLIVAAIALSFVSNLVLGFTAVFVPVILGVTLIIMGVSRNWAPWPWVVSIGFGILPASYMSLIKVCDNVGKVCVTGDDLHHSKQAVYSLILFALATALMLLKRSPARDAAIAVLTLAAEIWLIVKLRGINEISGQLVIFALIAISIAYEIMSRVRTEPSSQPTA